MGLRTVRLDDETEKVLNHVKKITGLSTSSALKRGLLTLHDEVIRNCHQVPYDVYRELDLGPGGYAIVPSTQVRQGILKALKRKHRR